MTWRFILIGCIGALIGCASVARVTQAPVAAVGRLLLPEEEEKSLGDELAAEVRAREKILDDPEVQAWVDAVQNRLLEAVPPEDQKFGFQTLVIDDPDTVNAFALPGGHLFIYSGLIATADSEAEVAAVLAHEIAHVTLDHPAQQLGARLGVETLRSIALGQTPGAIAQLATGIAAQGYIAAHSREDETEADSYGLSYLAGAGYDPQAMASFFRKLQGLEGSDPDVVSRFFASHPSPADRVGRQEALIRERGYRGGKESIVGNFDQIQARVGGASDNEK